MIVGIHQPNFMPWCGFFYKFFLSDVFIVMDSVQYSKGTVINRVKIRGAAGPIWLTVPVVTSGRLGQEIREVEIGGDAHWMRIHLNTLRTYYGRTPYFSEYFPVIETVYAAKPAKLIDLNHQLLLALLKMLGLDSGRIINLSTIGAAGKACDLVANIVKAVGGTTYLSGTGARDYNDPVAFERNGIDLVYMDFTHPRYRQVPHGDFTPGLSVVDLLFNHGPDSLDILRQSNLAFERILALLRK